MSDDVKVHKEVKSVILVFYQGGTKLKAATTHTPDEIQRIMETAKKEVKDAVIDTVNESEDVMSDRLFVTRNAMLFWSVYVPVTKAKSDIVIAPASALSGNNSR